jgi:hypothetical protein
MQELPTGKFHADPPGQAIDRLSDWQPARKEAGQFTLHCDVLPARRIVAVPPLFIEKVTPF